MRMVEPLAELRGEPLSSCSRALGMPAVSACRWSLTIWHPRQGIVCPVGAPDV